MTLVDGIGDEVIGVLILLFIVLLLAVAWCSTTVADRPLVRTAVLVITRTHQQQSSNAPTSVQAQPSSIPVEPGGTTPDSPSPEVTESITTAEVNVSEENVLNTETNNAESAPENGEAEISPELPDINSEMTPLSFVRKRVISNFTSLPDGSSNKEDATPVDETPRESESSSSSNPTNSDYANGITVRIKFLNDTQKVVAAQLSEPLGDFRRRHFSEELASNKIVRLIFNGQLLARDHETLQHFGFFDNCTIHCQISQARIPENVQATGNNNQENAPLDLAHLMMPIFGGILALVWYGRIYYRHLFNATSTFTLLAITGFYLLSLVTILVNHNNNNNSSVNNNNVNRPSR